MKVIEQEDISLNTDSTREFVQQSITTLFILSEPDFGDPQELGNQMLLSLPRDWQPGINLVHCIPLQTSKQAVKDKWSLCIFIQYTSRQWGPEMHKAEVSHIRNPPTSRGQRCPSSDLSTKIDLTSPSLMRMPSRGCLLNKCTDHAKTKGKELKSQQDWV